MKHIILRIGTSLIALIVIFSTALVFTHNKAASAANAGTPQMGGEIEDSINSYTSLLSALYTQDEQELARHSSNEIALAKEKIDPLRESYTNYGMKIVDATVSADVQTVQNIGETTIVDTILHTEITFLPSAVSGLTEPQKSSWDDSHTITLESAGTDMKRSGASDPSLQSDSVIPESSTSLNEITDSAATPATTDAPVGVTQPQLRTAGASPSYQIVTASEYAVKWTSGVNNGNAKNNFNPAYPYFDENCANFVSQVVHEGKVSYRGSIFGYRNDDTWSPNLGFGVSSYTWGGASNNHRFMRNYSGLFNEWTGSIYDMGRGGLLYTDWDANGSIDHALFVNNAIRTGFNSAGQMIFMPYISQKSNNRSNMPLSTYYQIAVSGHPKTLWYGLQVKWIY